MLEITRACLWHHSMKSKVQNNPPPTSFRKWLTPSKSKFKSPHNQFRAHIKTTSRPIKWIKEPKFKPRSTWRQKNTHKKSRSSFVFWDLLYWSKEEEDDGFPFLQLCNPYIRTSCCLLLSNPFVRFFAQNLVFFSRIVSIFLYAICFFLVCFQFPCFWLNNFYLGSHI